MGKKDFFSGLFTGIIVTAFIVCCIVCVKIITKQGDVSQSNGITNAVVNNSGNGGSINDKQYESVLDNPSVNNKIKMLETTIDKYFVDDVSQEDIENGIYDGIMASLNDPYAAYYTTEEFIEMINSTEGIYYGIGAVLMKSQTTLYPQVTGIIKNSPTSESEIQVDDYIYKVNGEDVYDMDLSEVVAKVKGDEGTFVTLTMIRPSTGDEFDVTLERRKVESPTVESEIFDRDSGYFSDDKKIGYITISEFDEVTVDQFAEELAVVKGSHVDGIIIDLRGNPGGSLTAVVEIAKMILPEGLVVYTEDKYGNREEYKCDGKHELDLPLVVLVNGGSASASEILAGAIKDYKLGTLVGTTTYGKGIVQRLVSLSDGSAVKLTVSHYYTPLGNDIHKIGIEPDVVVELDRDAYIEDGTDSQLEEAVKELLKKIK